MRNMTRYDLIKIAKSILNEIGEHSVHVKLLARLGLRIGGYYTGPELRVVIDQLFF
jgi:hypothetical protein